MNFVKKIPLILIILGTILILGPKVSVYGLMGYGLTLCVLGLTLCVLVVLIQIVIIALVWRDNPKLKQPRKYTTGIVLYGLGLALFVVGLRQYHSYFGALGLFIWGGVGSIPLLIGGIILLTIPTAPSLPNKKSSRSKK